LGYIFTSVLEYLDNHSILLIRLERLASISNRNIKPLDLNRILQRHRDTRKRAFQVDFRGSPFLGLGQEQLRDTIGLLVRLHRNFAICVKHVDGRDSLGLDIVHECFDGLVEELLVRC
jgi:hypothetical protein